MLDKTLVLSEIKILLDSNEDVLLSVLIDKAERDIKTYCNNQFINDLGVYEFPDNLVGALEDLVCYMYGRRGTEGKQSEGMGSVNATYETDVPQPIKRRLNTFKLMKVH